MVSEYPYQLVVFLDRSPRVGEPVYYGENGWYTQVAIKRRFKSRDDEDVFLNDLDTFFRNEKCFTIHTDTLVHPERMPVSVIAVRQTETLMHLHAKIISYLGDRIESRYPERDGDNYYPHVTAEYNNKIVITVDAYSKKMFTISKVWLLKDGQDENAVAYRSFDLKQ